LLCSKNNHDLKPQLQGVEAYTSANFLWTEFPDVHVHFKENPGQKEIWRPSVSPQFSSADFLIRLLTGLPHALCGITNKIPHAFSGDQPYQPGDRQVEEMFLASQRPLLLEWTGTTGKVIRLSL